MMLVTSSQLVVLELVSSIQALNTTSGIWLSPSTAAPIETDYPQLACRLVSDAGIGRLLLQVLTSTTCAVRS